LNDITFRVGRDGDAGFGAWTDPGTPSVTSQYNKAVIMDEFAGLDKGWNDPDMLMVGMNGMTTQMSQTHFTMWCMMNSPLMLGLDLRRVHKGDELYKIIANKELIALNQDALGLQAKRIFTTAKTVCGGGQMLQPDKDYITDCDRVDVLAKPLSDGSLALCFLNLSQEKKCGEFAVGLELIKKYLGKKLPADFYEAKSFEMTNLWSGEKNDVSFDKLSDVAFSVKELDACGNVTLKVVAR
jgi:alpha-galactosidase